MKTRVHDGRFVDVPAPQTVKAGDGVSAGSLFGVAVAAAAKGATVTIDTVGAFALSKVTSQNWAPGVAIHWDDKKNQATTASGGNLEIGIAAAAAKSGDEAGVVRLG